MLPVRLLSERLHVYPMLRGEIGMRSKKLRSLQLSFFRPTKLCETSGQNTLRRGPVRRFMS
jgi:hypothetical protein